MATNLPGLGKRLKRARDAADLTQEEAAEAIGIGRQTLITYESGEREPKASVLVKMSSVYGVSVMWLLGEEPSPDGPLIRRIRELPAEYQVEVQDFVEYKEGQYKKRKDA